jgi:trehalose utilization protein
LAVLELCNLPVLIEDSECFADIENKIVLKLMELFNQSQKQIFIALDKVKHYSEDLSIPSIIEKNIVMWLSKGNELFGKPWNVKRGNESAKSFRPFQRSNI